MRRVLDHSTRTVTARDQDGNERQQEQVAHVTFEDHAGALHTLVFHPPGTDVAGDNEPQPRIVGEHVPHFSFADPQAAVDAYLRGEIQ